MCLAIPSKITKISGKKGYADIGGVEKSVNLSLVPQANIGDYVLIHAGYAIERIDEQEALKTLSVMHELANLQDAQEDIYNRKNKDV